MKGKRTKKQCIEELVEPLNTLRKEKDVQDMVVHRFQALFLEEGVFSPPIPLQYFSRME